MVTSAKDWKNKANQARELELPSSNTALVRNPGMQAFLQAGIVPNELMGTVMDALETNTMPDLEKFKDDEKMLKSILLLVDNILVYCVVEPPVAPTPTPPTDAEGNPTGPAPERNPALLYADEVDIQDKMFIFQWAVGGTHDLDQFREEQEAALVGLSAKPTVARPAKRTSGPATKRRR